MSAVTQISGSDPHELWALAALPLAVGLDLAIGSVPGRALFLGWLDRLIGIVEEGVGRTVARLGGGRGGDLFGGVLLAIMVVGTVSSLVWLVVEMGDTLGELTTLIVRAAVIAAGLTIRSPGDQILSAVEATDPLSAARWLRAAGGSVPVRLDSVGVEPIGIAAVGELTSSRIVAPLFWLALGGPAAMWGFLAIRSLRDTNLTREGRADLASEVTTGLADLAEAIPAFLTWTLLTAAAGATRCWPLQAGLVGWRAGRTHLRSIPIWGQAALAGALGVRIPAGRIFAAARSEPFAWVGEPIQRSTGLTVVRAVRMMQVAALLAAGLAVLVTIVW